MDIRFKLDKTTLRRLKSVIKVSDTCVIRCLTNKITFIGDNIGHFKSLTVNCVSDGRYIFRVDHDILSILDDVDECVMKLCSQGDKVVFQYASTDEELDNGFVDGMSRTPLNSVDEHLLKDIIVALKSVETSLCNIKELSNLKEVIASARACEIGIEFNNGLLVSASDSIKMFKEVEDDELSFGLSIEAIKEIEKFKTDCKMHSCLNYLLLSRDNFVLGVKKSICSGIVYPPQFRDRSQANSGAVVQVKKLSSALNVYNKRLDKEHPGYCILDFPQSTLYINNGKSDFVRPLISRPVECLSGQSLKTIKIPLGVLHKLSALFKDAETFEVYSYGKIVRLCFSSGVNILISGETVLWNQETTN